MNFLLIQPDALRTHWPLIRNSLDAVQAKAPEDWIAEDVYHAIKSGSAACHLAIGDKGYAGLLITTLTQTEFSREPVFHIWITHNVSDADTFEAGMGLIRDMARKSGATKITFGSPRMGWAKRFKLVSATYEVPL